jgi:hypothetical protein
MTANELRIGNIIKGIGVNIEWVVEGFEGDCIYSGDGWRYLSYFEPIPLTEDWLLRFGFLRDTKYDFELKVNGVLFYGMCDNSQPINTGICILNLPESNINIKHVHQLQNLYFALTGEELTLKQ